MTKNDETIAVSAMLDTMVAAAEAGDTNYLGRLQRRAMYAAAADAAVLAEGRAGATRNQAQCVASFAARAHARAYASLEFAMAYRYDNAAELAEAARKTFAASAEAARTLATAEREYAAADAAARAARGAARGAA